MIDLRPTCVRVCSATLVLPFLLVFGPARELPRCRAADAPHTYIYNGPESHLDVRYQYQWEVLRTALEKTQAQHGAFRMVPATPMSETRQVHELINATGKLTVMYLDAQPEFERRLLAIHIPVDRNLAGYRVFLIRPERREDFRRVSTLDDLRKFTWGLGRDWGDVAILRANGFRVVTGSSYDGLFEMLENRRFDVFPRAAVEILDEVEHRKTALPEITMEESLCLFYPLPMYFWFARTDEGRRLRARAELGMRTMLEDGSFLAIFEKHQRHKIEQLRLSSRRIFRIENPFLSAETPWEDKRLWFDPQADRP